MSGDQTTGTDTTFDQTLHIAAIPTDAGLNELDRIETGRQPLHWRATSD
jgi:hypothetical protein